MELKEILSNSSKFDKDKIIQILNSNLTKSAYFTKNTVFVGKSSQLTLLGLVSCDLLVPAYHLYNENNDPLTARMILDCNKCFNVPWGIKNKTFLCWDHEIRFELAMFDNHLKNFLQFKLT